MKKFSLLFSLFLVVVQLSAQEVLLPAYRGTKFIQPENQSKVLQKNGSLQIPVVDFFETNQLDKKIWRDSSATPLNRKLIFNCLDANDQPYSGASGTADVMQTKAIDIRTSSGALVLTFVAEPGSNIEAGDTLVLEALSGNQVWTFLWSAGSNLNNAQEIYLTLPRNVFYGPEFALRFSYSGDLKVSKEDCFRISKLALINHLSPGWKPTLAVGMNLNTSFVAPDSKAAFMRESTRFGAGILLDGINGANSAYSTGYGGSDSVWVHPINLSGYSLSDSLFFSFSAEALAGIQAQDSLILEFRNNLGQWVRALSLGNFVAGQQRDFSLFVNSGRNRHAFFRPRFILKSGNSAADTAKFLLGAFAFNRRNSLPFIDDFSSSRTVSDRFRWADSFVYVNNDFPLGQPSVQVATFDGLNQFGNPYSSFALKGTADVLTSWPFNLRGLKPSDSVYLSFYCQYELQGATGQVFPDDSFYLELRNSKYFPESYTILFRISANQMVPGSFTRFDIPLKDTALFHEEVQFRFRNRGSLTGNLSHWHLDFVRFDKGRKANDPYNDVTLTNTPAVRLGQFTSMSWKQYSANPSKYSNDTVSLRLSNYDNQIYLLDYFRTVTNPEGASINTFNNITNIFQRNDTVVRFNRPVSFTSSSTSADSLVFRTSYRVSLSSSQKDAIGTNDTFSTETVFSNYLAYDDGSAEGGYGIKNKTNCGAALRFKLEQPDSIYGLYVYFNQSESNVSQQNFRLKIWKSISPLMAPANDDLVLYQTADIKPSYSNKINGFTAYKIEPPIAVSDSFLIGWEQTQAYVLNIGFDKNYPFGTANNLFFKQDGQWYPSEIAGALMMRPILGKWLELPASVSETAKPEQTRMLHVFPNPGNSTRNVQSQNPEEYEVELFDLSGRQLSKTETQNGVFTVPEGIQGIFIARFKGQKSGRIEIHKLINQ